MKTTLRRQTVVATAAAMLIVAGCTTPEGQPDRTATGALTGGAIGAGTGAIIGSASGRAGAGALIGGAIGALTGGIIGNAMDQQQREILAQQSPQTLVRVDRGQPLGLADIKALSKAGISDELIISQIRASRTMYRLSTAEILDLKDSGVSDHVIDFMVNTPGGWNLPPPPPPSAFVSSPLPPLRLLHRHNRYLHLRQCQPSPALADPVQKRVSIYHRKSTVRFCNGNRRIPSERSLYVRGIHSNPRRLRWLYIGRDCGYYKQQQQLRDKHHISHNGGFRSIWVSLRSGFLLCESNSGAHSVSVQFTLTAPALVVLVGAASSQQQLAFSGLPNLVTDVPYNTVVATAIAHASVAPGEYTAQETSLDTAAAQDPNAMVDLLGVFIFSDYPSAATSSDPQIPLPVLGSTGVSGASRPSPAPSTSEPPEP